MTIGRAGKIFCRSAAKNGCADAQIPVQDNTPPFSNRRARDCTAGAFEMSANKLPVADDGAFCGKRRQVRSETSWRQVCADTKKFPKNVLAFARAAGSLCGLLTKEFYGKNL